MAVIYHSKAQFVNRILPNHLTIGEKSPDNQVVISGDFMNIGFRLVGFCRFLSRIVGLSGMRG